MSGQLNEAIREEWTYLTQPLVESTQNGSIITPEQAWELRSRFLIDTMYGNSPGDALIPLAILVCDDVDGETFFANRK